MTRDQISAVLWEGVRCAFKPIGEQMGIELVRVIDGKGDPERLAELIRQYAVLSDAINGPTGVGYALPTQARYEVVLDALEQRLSNPKEQSHA